MNNDARTLRLHGKYVRRFGPRRSYGRVGAHMDRRIKVYLDTRREAPRGWTLAKSAQEAIALLEGGGVTHLSASLSVSPGPGNDAAQEASCAYQVLRWIEQQVALHSFGEPQRIIVRGRTESTGAKMDEVIENIRRIGRENVSGGGRGAFVPGPCWDVSDQFVGRVLEVVLSATRSAGEFVFPEVVKAAFPVHERGSVGPALVLLQQVWRAVRWDHEGGRNGILVVGALREWMQELDQPRDPTPYLEHWNARSAEARQGWSELVKKHGLSEDADDDTGGGFYPGWLPIIDEALGKMIATGWDRDLFDLKSKFCRLVLRVAAEASPEVHAIIRAAEEKSGRACEYCGAPHGLQTPMSGTALCEKCLEEDQARWSHS